MLETQRWEHFRRDINAITVVVSATSRGSAHQKVKAKGREAKVKARAKVTMGSSRLVAKPGGNPDFPKDLERELTKAKKAKGDSKGPGIIARVALDTRVFVTSAAR